LVKNYFVKVLIPLKGVLKRVLFIGVRLWAVRLLAFTFSLQPIFLQPIHPSSYSFNNSNLYANLKGCCQYTRTVIIMPILQNVRYDELFGEIFERNVSSKIKDGCQDFDIRPL